MDAWDGPAAMGVTNGVQALAMLDRNGLRPARYCVTTDDMLILASETGVLDIPPEKILYKERLRPGRMLVVDTEAGRVISDDEIKSRMAAVYPYDRWIQQLQLTMEELPENEAPAQTLGAPLWQLQKNFGYTNEQVEKVILPMADKGIEPTGSMGADLRWQCFPNARSYCMITFTSCSRRLPTRQLMPFVRRLSPPRVYT